MKRATEIVSEVKPDIIDINYGYQLKRSHVKVREQEYFKTYLKWLS